MAEMSISEVIKQTGLAASTLRYYEEIGLLTPVGRKSRRRQYDASVLRRLAFIQTAQQAGFTLAELRILLDSAEDPEDDKIEWRELVDRKLSEMEVRLRKIKSMTRLLKDITDCQDDDLMECIVLTGKRHHPGLIDFAQLDIE